MNFIKAEGVYFRIYGNNMVTMETMVKHKDYFLYSLLSEYYLLAKVLHCTLTTTSTFFLMFASFKYFLYEWNGMIRKETQMSSTNNFK